MDARTRTALVVCDELPLPGYAGHTTYNRAFIQALTEAGFCVELFITGHRFRKPHFVSTQELKIPNLRTTVPHAYNPFGDHFWVRPHGLLRLAYHRSGLKRMLQRQGSSKGQTVQIGKWLDDRPMQLALEQRMTQMRPDFVLIDTIFRSPLLERMPAATTRILIGHDVFHQRCRALLDAGLKPAPDVSATEEAHALGRFDGVIAITENDARSYRTLCPALPVLGLPSPIAVRRAVPARTHTQRMLYIGSRAQVNVDGLLWFLESVWPSVKRSCPGAQLDVVGSICSEIPGDFAGVTLHGRLDDFSALADTAMFAINPVRAGSGLKIKMLDYFAHGLGCLTTPAGALGFPESDDSPIGVCNDEREYIAACLRCLNDLALCRQSSGWATAYAEQFSRESFSARLLAWFEELAYSTQRNEMRTA